MSARSILAAALLAAALAGAAPPGPAPAATGRADVRLVRLLSEVPDSVRSRLGPVHNVRVRLVSGNVLILKKGGDFAAVLPIERIDGSPDSLRYFFYVERAPLLWVIPGSHAKGIMTVADGGDVRFDSFRLAWGADAGAVGWIYFPDAVENAALKFSVVSGRTVDQADPKDTKYWVELGAPGKSGF
jgi:hypothetical protein